MDYLLSRAAVEMDLKNDNSHHSGKRCHTQGQAVVNALNFGFRLCRSFFQITYICNQNEQYIGRSWYYFDDFDKKNMMA